MSFGLGFMIILLLSTYLLDGFLFFYYKKNEHLDRKFKNYVLNGVRLAIVFLILLKRGF